MRFLFLAALVGLAALCSDPRPALAADAADVSDAAGNDTHDRPTLYWHMIHSPPVFIRRGPNADLGVGDRIVQHITAQMDDYQHVAVESVLNRSLQELAARRDVCIPGVLKTEERQKRMVFTDPLFRLMPNQLVVLREHADVVRAFLNDAGAVDLASFARSSGLMPGVIRDRLYSAGINAVIDDVLDEVPTVRVPHAGFARLMLRGRFDYTFGFPFEATYQFANEGQGNAYLTFPIAGEAPVVHGYFACSDTPFGRKVVARINAIAAREDTAEAMDRLLSQWNGLGRHPSTQATAE